jgi:hypothetical protein
MDTAIICYSVCASVFMIWCSLQTNLAYVVISDTLLNRWKIERQNLIVIDLFPEATGWVRGGAPDSLQVSEHALASLLQWIPPPTTVVFCHRIHIDHFDGKIEETLFRAAIDTVYLLEARESSLSNELSRRNLHPLPLHHDRCDDN